MRKTNTQKIFVASLKFSVIPSIQEKKTHQPVLSDLCVWNKYEVIQYMQGCGSGSVSGSGFNDFVDPDLGVRKWRKKVPTFLFTILFL
jgi:hypothetical protein